MLDTSLGELSFVFEGVGNCPETEGKRILASCASSRSLFCASSYCIEWFVPVAY